MLYEAYKNKLEKRKRRFERFWRFRLLFLLIFLMLLAAAGAMMGVAGQVTAVSVPQTKFFYGQPLSMQASSVFGGAGFEFRLKGTEVWSEKEPRAAGTYECRAVGKSIVGTSRPGGEVFSFTIDPMETVVSVADSSIVYGNTPSFTANLCYDDVLQVNDYTKVEKSGDIVNIVADLDAVTILSADGEDVTASYSVNVADRDVTEIARKLTVTTASETYEYDGKPHSAEEIILEGDGLAEGHRIEEEGTIFASLTDVGEIQNCPERDGHFHILDEDGNDVTGKYKVTRKYGTLKVTPRELTVTTQGDEFTYDGKEHEYGVGTLKTDEGDDGGLLVDLGHEIRFTGGNYAFTEANEEGYQNAPIIGIYVGDDEVTGNYDVSVTAGTVIIHKRALHVTTQSATFTYDGKEYKYDETTLTYNDEGDDAGLLVDLEHEIRFTGGNYAFTEANEDGHINNPTIAIFVGAGNDEVTANYDVSVTTGTVTIHKRELTLSTESHEIPYDGTEHTYNDLTADGLAGKQTITRTDTLCVQNAKEYPNEPQFTIQDGETPISAENYEIIEHYGTVTVTKLAIKVETHSAEFVYDGIEHRYGVEEKAYDLEGALAAGQELKFFDVLVMKDAGERSNEPDIRVYDGEDDVSANYDIDKVYGKVHILQRVVEVTTNSQSFPYDGQAHTELGFEILPAQEGRYLPVEGHTLVPSAVASITNYSDTPVSNELAFTVSDGTPSRNRDATDNLTGNYIIRIVTYGELTVQKREVTLTTGSDTVTYDAKEHGKASYTAVGTQLVDGHTVEAAFKQWTEANEAGYENSLDETAVKIKDANGEDVTANYTVHWQWGTVVILRREVTLCAGDYHAVYDGKAHTAEEWSVESGSLAEDHYAAGTYEAFTDAGSYDNDPDGKAICDGAGTPVTQNYHVTWKAGSIVIDLRPLTVTAHGNTWEYDAAAHSEAGYDVEGLADGHVYKANVTAPQIVNVWDSRVNELDFDEVFIGPEGGDDCGKNYDVTYVRTNRVEITPREITVTTKGDAIVYDGTEHTYASAEVTSEKQLAAETHRLVLEGYASFLDAREAPYSNEMTVKVYANGEDISRNYTLIVVYGTVKIDRRPITVLTHDRGPYVYDGISWRETDYENCTVVYPEGAPKLDGHEVKIEYTQKDKMANVGTHEIAFTARIVAEVYGDVTENYDVTVVFGEVEITLRPLHIQTQTAVFTYNGQEHRYDIDTLELLDGTTRAPNQIWRIVETAENKDSIYIFKEAKGENDPYTNTPVVDIFDENGKPVTENYEITYTYGTVTIKYRPITITSKSKEFVYDDTEHSFWGADAYTYTENGKDVGLALNQNLVVTGGTTLIEVDEKDNVLIYHISDENGDNVTDNYEIHDEYGTITVTKRKVKILTGSLDDIVYDGEPHKADSATDWNWEYGWEEEGFLRLADGHTLKIEYKAFIDASFAEKDGKYINEPLSFAIVRGDGSTVDYEKNYDLTRVYGTVEILRRKVKILTGSHSYVYNGEPRQVMSYTSWNWDQGWGTEEGNPYYKLVDGHTLSTTYPSITNVWETKAENNKLDINSARILQGGQNVTENYDITWEWGTITITPRPVALTSDEGSHVYDDTDFSVETFTWEKFTENERGLVSGHQVSADVTAPILHDVGSKLNELKYANIKVMAGSEDVTQNYQFDNYYYNTITVTPRPLTITTPSDTHVYDGNAFELKECTPEPFNEEGHTGLVTGHEFLVEYTKWNSITTVQLLNNEMTLGITIQSGEKEVTGNYELRYQWGTLEVTKRPVTITTHDGEFVYDGQGHKVEEYTAEEVLEDGERGILAGHILSANYPTYTNVWDTANGNNTVSSVRILGNVNGGEGADDLTENYEITWVNGTITITPRPVNVTTGSESFVYDGQSHSVMGYTAEEFDADGKRGLVYGHEITAETYASFINFMETKDIKYNNEWKGEYHIYHGEPGAGEDLIRNYDITWTWGTITITKRHVLITSQGGTWGYDGQPHSADFDYERADGNGDRGVLSGHSLTVLGKEVTNITDTLGEDGKYVFGDVENTFDDGDVKIVLTTYGGVSVKDNYEIEVGDLGRLRVQTAIYVFLYTHNKQYDGKPLIHTQSEVRFLAPLPAGLSTDWIHITFTGITEPGVLTAAGVLTNSICTVSNGDTDLTKQNRFIFVGGNPKDPKEDATVLNVTQRKLTIHTINMKVSRTDEGSDVERDYHVNGSDQSLYYLTVNTLLEGHHLQCTMTGQLLLAQVSAKNTLLKENVKVLDSNENDVTEYYDITIEEEGTITWLNEPTTATGGATSPQSEALPPDNKQ